MDGAAHWRVGDPAPPPLPPRSEVDVLARWQDGPPLVSILCATYQHADFIEDALRGFLGQDTDFPFEVIVRDDASTDGTAEIVRDYAERYPRIVRAILEPVNRFPTVTPVTPLLGAASGLLLAFCEGDDYWIDELKLAVQSRTMMSDRSVAVSHHSSIRVFGDRIVGLPSQPAIERTSAWDLRRTEGGLGLRTMCIRVQGLTVPSYQNLVPQWDKFLTAQLGTLGDALHEATLLPAVYREHGGGVWSMRGDREHRIDRSRTNYWLTEFFSDYGDRTSAQHHLARGVEATATAFLQHGVDPRLRLAVRFTLGSARSTVRRLMERLRLRRRPTASPNMSRCKALTDN